MNYAFMSFSCPELSLDEVIKVAKDYGYEGIEPRIDVDHKHGIELNSSASFRKECKRKAEENDISLCCIATSCSYANPETCQEQIDNTHKTIDLAGDIGVPCIRVFGGKIPEGVVREEAIGLLVESMQAVADHARKRQVVICMETHDDWCDPQHLAQVMEQVDHPAIAVNWDIMHPVRVAKVTMDEAFRILSPWIKHVHFHDGVTEENGGLTLKPIGEGKINHGRAVELLKAGDYNGFLSGEWIDWEPYGTHLPRELSIMKQYEQK